MKPIKTIYYSAKYSQWVGSVYCEDLVDIVENVNGQDIANYQIRCKDLRSLRSQFTNDKDKYQLEFIRG